MSSEARLPPPITGPDDLVGFLRVRKRLSAYYHPDTLRIRLQREPTEDEAFEAGASWDLIRAARGSKWRTLNQILALIAAEKKPEVAPPEAEPTRSRRPWPAGLGQEEVTRVQQAIKKSLRQTFLKPPPGMTYKDLTNEVFVTWAERGAPLPAEAHIDDIARDLRARFRPAQKAEVRFKTADPGAVRAEAQAAAEAVEEEAAEVKEQQLTAAERLLNQLRHGDQADRVFSVLLALHMGEGVFPAQPKALTKRVNVGGSRLLSAQADLTRFHAPKRPGTSTDINCPTCRLISRYVRQRDLTPEQVSRIVEGLLLRARTDVG